MKFKISILRASTILALSILTSQTFAENISLNPSFDSSWQPYVGGSLGYGRMSARNSWSETAVLSTLSGKNNFNSKGFVGVVHMGIQKVVAPTIKIGGEIYGFLESQKASIGTAIGNIPRAESLKKENGGGIKTKAGYLFDTHSFVYGHLGVEKAGFKYTVSRNGLVPKSRKYLWGMPFGVGIETSLGCAWTARIEYIHTVYQKWNTGSHLITAVTTSKAKISPSQDSIVIGASYTF